MQIPIGKSLGPVRLHRVLLNLDRETSGDAPKMLIRAAVSFSAQIGPVLATVDLHRPQVRARFSGRSLESQSALPNVDVGFVPPAGIGLAVDAEERQRRRLPVPRRGEASVRRRHGAELSGVVALKAIGLLSTRLPDGEQRLFAADPGHRQTAQPNASLLQLPIGLAPHRHRRADRRSTALSSEDAVRSGLKDHTLESILFPKDPVRNAPTIIAALERVFPARRGSYLLGLMVQLQWGAPMTLITVNSALILELGARATASSCSAA